MPGGECHATSQFASAGKGASISTNGTVNGSGSPGQVGMVANTASNVFGGGGGCTIFGDGGDPLYSNSNIANTAGSSAQPNTGSGGGGAIHGSAGIPIQGGDGGSGLIIITEFK